MPKRTLHLGNYAAKAFDLSYTYIIGWWKVAEKGNKTEEAITIDENPLLPHQTLQANLSQKERKSEPTSDHLSWFGTD